MEPWLGNKEFWIRGKVNALNENTRKYMVLYTRGGPAAEGHLPPGMEETLWKPEEKPRKGTGGMEAYLGNNKFWIRRKVNVLNENTGKYMV